MSLINPPESFDSHMLRTMPLNLETSTSAPLNGQLFFNVNQVTISQQKNEKKVSFQTAKTLVDFSEKAVVSDVHKSIEEQKAMFASMLWSKALRSGFKCSSFATSKHQLCEKFLQPMHGHRCSATSCPIWSLPKGTSFLNPESNETLVSSGDVFVCENTGAVHLCGSECNCRILHSKKDSWICAISSRSLAALIDVRPVNERGVLVSYKKLREYDDLQANYVQQGSDYQATKAGQANGPIHATQSDVYNEVGEAELTVYDDGGDGDAAYGGDYDGEDVEQAEKVARYKRKLAFKRTKVDSKNHEDHNTNDETPIILSEKKASRAALLMGDDDSDVELDVELKSSLQHRKKTTKQLFDRLQKVDVNTETLLGETEEPNKKDEQAPAESHAKRIKLSPEAGDQAKRTLISVTLSGIVDPEERTNFLMKNLTKRHTQAVALVTTLTSYYTHLALWTDDLQISAHRASEALKRHRLRTRTDVLSGHEAFVMWYRMTTAKLNLWPAPPEKPIVVETYVEVILRVWEMVANSPHIRLSQNKVQPNFSRISLGVLYTMSTGGYRHNCTVDIQQHRFLGLLDSEEFKNFKFMLETVELLPPAGALKVHLVSLNSLPRIKNLDLQGSTLREMKTTFAAKGWRLVKNCFTTAIHECQKRLIERLDELEKNLLGLPPSRDMINAELDKYLKDCYQLRCAVKRKAPVALSDVGGADKRN